MLNDTNDEPSRRVVLGGAALAALVSLTKGAAAVAVGKLHVIAELNAKPGSEAALRDLMVPFAKGAIHEHGCLHYTLMEDQDQPGRLMTYEIWTDRAALDAHLKTPQITAAMPKLEPLLSKPFTLAHLSALT